jgi:protein translocase SecG subunit
MWITVLKYGLLVLQAIFSIFLIFIVAAQTTKNEGLTGSIGGQMTPSFKGKPGMDEQLRTITMYGAAIWGGLSLIVSLLWSYFPDN